MGSLSSYHVLSDHVHVVFLQAWGHWVFRFHAVRVRSILNAHHRVVLNVSGEISFGNVKLVIVQSGLISDLLADELRMVSRWDALVNDLFLLRVDHQVGVSELSHF